MFAVKFTRRFSGRTVLVKMLSCISDDTRSCWSNIYGAASSFMSSLCQCRSALWTYTVKVNVCGVANEFTNASYPVGCLPR